MKESSRFSQTSKMVSAAKPNKVAFQWRFYKFATILKNQCFENTGLSTFSIFLTMIYTVLVSVYPLIFHDQGRTTSEIDVTIFPFGSPFQGLVPGVISESVCLLLSLIIICASIVAFIVCFHNPNTILFLHPFLSQQIHSIIFPFNSVVISYSLMYTMYHLNSYPMWTVVHVLYLILSLVYILMLMILMYIDNNSLVRPNNVTSEWFLGFTTMIPPVTIFNVFVSMQSQNMPTAALWVMYILLLLVNLGAVLTTIIEMPMLNGIFNSMIPADYIVTMVCNIFSFIRLVYEISLPIYVYMLIPIIFAILFVIIRIVIDKRRTAIQQFLDQFESTGGEFTVSAIATTLESLNTERQVRLLIYEGLQSGNQTVFSPAFIQFCLERFPESTWMISYVSFLFAIAWGSNPRIYRFMLHTLSLDYFGIRNFQLYQAIFCLMQTAESISPVISRELDEYRCEVVQFASIHRTFWRSILHSDPASFHDAFFALHAQRNKLSKELKIMEMKYPYCSSAQIEIALFYADVKHNFMKSSEFYRKAVQLLKPKRTYITNDMYTNYSMIFPINAMSSEESEPDDTYGDELRFISLMESHEHALRYMTMVSPNDEYLQALSHAFSVPTNHQPVEIHFDKERTVLVKATFVAMFAFYIVSVIMLLVFTNTFETNREQYNNHIILINDTVSFRTNVQIAKQDIRLVASLELDIFSSIMEDSFYFNTTSSDWTSKLKGLYELAIEHLTYTDELLYGYLNLVNHRSYTVDVNFTILGCDTTNCTLPYLFSDLHHYIIYIEKTETPSQEMISAIMGSLNMLCDELIDLAENVFNQLSDIHEKWMVETSRDTINLSLILLFIVFVVGFALILVNVMSMHTMKQNIYAVIKTIQPSILKNISSVFDKLLSLEQHQRQVPRDYTFFISIFCCCMSYLSVIGGFLYLFIMSKKYYVVTKFADKVLPVITQTSNLTQFLTFTIGLLEHSVRYGLDNSIPLSAQQEALSGLALNSSEGCVHFLFNTTCDDCYSTTPIFNELGSVVLWIGVVVFILVSICFVTFYLYFGSKVIGLSSSVADIMKFIPSQARRSNPVLAKIMAGQETPKEEVFDFAEDVHEPVTTFDYFCFLFLDQMENVIEIRGDIEEYLSFRPANLGEIYSYLLKHTKDNPVALKQFFEAKRPLDTRSVAIDDVKEIALTFSRKGTILLIKDDSHHQIYNSKLRMVERIQSSIKEGVDRRKPSSMPQAILAIFATNDKNARTQMIQKLEKIGRVADTRFQKVVLIAEIDKAKELHTMAKQFWQEIPTLKVILNAGSPISVLQSAMTIEKTRVYGAAYDEARLMISQIGEHEFYMTQKFSSLLQ